MLEMRWKKNAWIRLEMCLSSRLQDAGDMLEIYWRLAGDWRYSLEIGWILAGYWLEIGWTLTEDWLEIDLILTRDWLEKRWSNAWVALELHWRCAGDGLDMRWSYAEVMLEWRWRLCTLISVTICSMIASLEKNFAKFEEKIIAIRS